MKLLFISLCFCLSLFCCSGQVIQIGGLAINVLRFGLDIVKFVKDKKLSRDNDIVDKLKERISTTTSELKTSIGLSSRLGNIDDAVINIHSSMIDIVNIVESNTYTERNEYIRLFVYRFEQNGVIKHVRFLPELLTYTIPGVSGKLIDLVADNNRCNMTALDEFKKFYANLLSDGISLQLLFLHLNTELPLNKTINEWTEWLQQISHTFDSKKASCMKSFPKLAQEDVNNAVDAVRLWSDSKQRYPWKTSDVIFLKPYGTYQFIYHKSKEDHLFWKKSSERYKIAVFNDINKKEIVPEVLVAASETIKSSIEGETDKKAALHVGQAVEAHLKDQGLAINAIVVFFDGGDLSPEKIQIDEESPVIRMTIDGVKLKYCYDGFIGCAVDVKNWLGSTKEVTGKLRVYAYVYEAENKNGDYSTETSTPKYKTSASVRNLPVYVAFYCLLTVLIF